MDDLLWPEDDPPEGAVVYWRERVGELHRLALLDMDRLGQALAKLEAAEEAVAKRRSEPKPN